MGTLLFTNARLVLDDADDLTAASSVLVTDNRITEVGGATVTADRVIDVGGRTLMPGLIDAHAHITGLSLSPRNAQYEPAEITAAATDYLRARRCWTDSPPCVRRAVQITAPPDPWNRVTSSDRGCSTPGGP